MLRWLWLALSVLILDQGSKQFVEAQLTRYDQLSITPFFNLVLAYNEGAAFSFLADQGGWQRWFFVFLALAVVAVLVVWLGRLKRSERTVAIALGLIIGGAVGNLIDRLLYGHVIDFLDIYYQQWHWPAFNLADSAITLGVILMFYDAFFGASEKSGN